MKISAPADRLDFREFSYARASFVDVVATKELLRILNNKEKSALKTEESAPITEKSALKTEESALITEKSALKIVDKIILLIKDDPTIKISSICDALGIKKRAVAKHIANLKAKGLIERIGSPRNGHWEVIAK